MAEADATSLGTDTQARRATDALHTGKPFALGAFTEYLSTFSNNLERFRIERSAMDPHDEAVVRSIDALGPYKDQLLNVLYAVAVHAQTTEYGARFHSFLESLFKYTQPKEGGGSYFESDFDNFAFLLHELFLSACALFLKNQRFDLVRELIGVDYYLPRTYHSSDAVSSHDRFSAIQLPSLDERKKRLSLNRMSLHADLLLKRTEGSLLHQEDLLQTDLFLYLRSEFLKGRWYPTTYMFTANVHKPFEIFARATSANFFERIRPLLGVESLQEFKALVDSMKRYGYGREGGSLGVIVGIETIGTRP